MSPAQEKQDPDEVRPPELRINPGSVPGGKGNCQELTYSGRDYLLCENLPINSSSLREVLKFVAD